MPDFWVRAGAIAAAVLGIFLGGYFVKGKIEEAEQADILRQQIKTQIERQDAMAATAEKTEAELVQARSLNAKLNRKWSEIRAQDPHSCLLGDSRIGLLRDATGPLGEAPR